MILRSLQCMWQKSVHNVFQQLGCLHKVTCRKYGSKTIYALSSGSGKSAIALIRVSGPNSRHALCQVCGKTPRPRIASVRKLYHPVSKELLDKAMVLWFPGPQSFTGEDCAEFHVHGGSAVVAAVLEAFGCISGLQPAQAGEFTKQAFLNGKFDLTEAEGLSDLIHAETEAQRKQALRQMGGDLSELFSGWRTRLMKCLGNSEAFIDFHEEENIEDDILDDVSSEVFLLISEIKNHLNDSRRGERLRDGLNVVIAGEPNVGKSSLLNSICQRPAAIVSPIAGTTRDIVETALNIAGYPVIFSDTAGLRATQDPVESEGVARALQRVSLADLKILVLDAEKHKAVFTKGIILSDYISRHIKTTGLGSGSPQVKSLGMRLDNASTASTVTFDLTNTLVVLNKMDLIDSHSLSVFMENHHSDICALSCHTGLGFDGFMDKLVHKVKALCGDPLQGNPSLTQTRHRHHLLKCCSHLDQFSDLLSRDIVLAVEQLRLAAGQLGHVTGVISAEDVLDVIFRDFCIGK